jgi:uncharacterized protein YjaG (DUF416 family)
MSKQIVISLLQNEGEKLEKLMKLSGKTADEILRTALNEYYEELMSDEERKELERINALLDVQ